METVLSILQVIAAIAMIAMTLLQTTKSEGSTGTTGMGWGTIGGKSSATIRTRWGIEEHLNRITMYVAASFIILSILTAVVRFMRQG
jgi:protein translocase SecG subunit